MLCGGAALAGQSVSVSGRVLRGGGDTVPLANAVVVLHRMSSTNAGPIDSVRSDARGRYRLALRHPDSTSAYVVSVWYDSIAYFSVPLSVAGRPAVHVEDVVAFPSSLTGPPLRLARRLATISGAGNDGTREVLEILELENPGQSTRITNDTLVPTWAGRLPERTGQYRAGQGDVSPEAMRFRNDSVLIYAPIPPGPAKQLSYDYTLAAGGRVEIRLPPGKFRAQLLLPYIIGVVAAGMLVALVWALRRRPPASRLT